MASQNPFVGSAETTETPVETKVEINLLGQRLVLRSSQMSAEAFQEITQIASRKLDAAQERSKGAPAHQIALLALLDLAEEYVSAKKKTQNYKDQMTEKSNQLLNLIEAEFK